MIIKPKCLSFGEREFKGAGYTSDGFMLPCCWMDEPALYPYVVGAGLKDPELALDNNDRLEDIFLSDQWENFFQTLLKDPENACYMCKKKCGLDVDKEKVIEEEQTKAYERLNRNV